MALKGSKLSEEHKRKIGDANRRKVRTPEFKAFLSMVNTGKSPSLETRQKMSRAQKGRKASDDTRKRMSEAQRKWNRSPLSEEHKRKTSESMKGRKITQQHRSNISTAVSELWKNPQHREACLEGTKRWYEDNPQIRENLSVKRKENWKDPEYRNRQVQLVRKGNSNTPNKMEQKLAQFLEKRWPGDWKFVGDGSVVFNGYNPDFINVNGKKLIIEMFGDYWHRGEDPADRAKLFAPYGFKTLVIWEHELRNLLAVHNKVMEFIHPTIGE